MQTSENYNILFEILSHTNKQIYQKFRVDLFPRRGEYDKNCGNKSLRICEKTWTPLKLNHVNINLLKVLEGVNTERVKYEQNSEIFCHNFNPWKP